MNKEIIMLAQMSLKDMGLYSGAIDGLRGSLTANGERVYIQSGAAGWNNPKRGNVTVALAQLFLDSLRIDVGPIDGILGIRTNAAITQWVNSGMTGELRGKKATVEIPTTQANKWPRDSSAAMNAFYGQPGTNLTTCQWAYPIYYFGKRVTNDKFTCNIKVKDSLERISIKVAESYSMDDIRKLGLDKWAGCFNNRRITNGTRLSTHAWAAAVDWDSERNQFRWGRGRASLAHADCVEWWKIWESEGWLSLGRVRNFDWMHVQAAI